MRDDADRYVSLALLLLGSALAGYAFAFTVRKSLRAWRAEFARQRFRVIDGSFNEDDERPFPLLRDE